MLSLFPQTTQVENDLLIIGGCDTTELVKQFGTPLYVLDDMTIRNKCAEYRDSLAQRYPESAVCYACKALLNRALAQLFKEEGLGLDVVSGGELAIAKSVDFPMERVYFNGNNKSRQELEIAIEWGVGQIVVDNTHELSTLSDVVQDTGDDTEIDILLRLSPAVDPHTHDHLKTGGIGTKFGFPLSQAEAAVAKTIKSRQLRLVGLHFHIGSQILDLSFFKQAIEVTLKFAASIKAKHGFRLAELSIGGGLGIAYTDESPPPTITEFAYAVADTIISKCEALNLDLPRLIVEPGRSIMGQSGVALYTVGAIKETEGARKYVSIDGGMGDNIRPSLYEASYKAVIANKVASGKLERVTIAGKFCESGDILIWDIDLPKVEPGDILAVPCCGAYCLPLASNYNAALRPAVVMVRDGDARMIRRRESYDDLMRCDIL